MTKAQAELLKNAVLTYGKARYEFGIVNGAGDPKNVNDSREEFLVLLNSMIEEPKQ